MEQHLRDLGSAELWHTSLERSRKRRVLAHDGRRRMARKKQASGAVTAAMLLTPVLQVGGAMASNKGRSQVAQSSPANRAIDARTLNVVLEEGATGARVAQLQQLLGVDADGIFGPETAAAVRAFQGRAGLAADGIVGATTWRALFGSSSTRGVAADSVVDGKGYQVTVSKASKREAAIAGGGKGPVAKIVLTSAPQPKPKRSAPRHDSEAPGHSEAPAHSQPRGGGETRTVADQSAPSAPAAPEPAVDTGDGESVACGSGRLVNPVRGATQTGRFGESRPGHMHAGVDLAAPTGTPIHAAACGVVSFAGQQSGYGNIVCIDHGSGFTTCYAHMSRFGTHNGARVHAGDVIGYVGSTGDATGPHLHFETRVNGQARDPQPYLNGSQQAPGTHARTTTAASKQSSASSGSTKSSSTKTKSSSSTQTGAASAAAPSSSSSPQKPVYSESRPASAQPQPEQQQAATQPQAAPAEQQSQAAQAPAPAPAPAPQPAAAAAPAPVEPAAPAAPAPQPEAPAAPVEQAAPAAPAPQPEAPAAPAEPAPDPAPQAAAPQPEAPAPATPAEAPAAPQADAPAAPAAEAPAAPQPEAPAAPAEQPVAAAAG
jgi:Meckel syndrome type 1 protein